MMSVLKLFVEHKKYARVVCVNLKECKVWFDTFSRVKVDKLRRMLRYIPNEINVMLVNSLQCKKLIVIISASQVLKIFGFLCCKPFFS